jgi:hypothetical protein
METVLGYAIPFLIRTVFLLLALWVMVKLQKFQYNFPGLLGSAALASALDMVPYCGHFIAVPVLYGCLMKVTREDLTGVIFTGAIAYALVFVMNLFFIGSLVGGLLAFSIKSGSDKAMAREPEEEEQSVTNSNDLALTQKTNAQPLAAPSAKPKPEVVRNLELKGVIKGANPMAMIFTAGKTHTLGVGESFLVETPRGKVKVRLEKVEDTLVVLNAAGEQVELHR